MVTGLSLLSLLNDGNPRHSINRVARGLALQRLSATTTVSLFGWP
jgi:hypothetical protein